MDVARTEYVHVPESEYEHHLQWSFEHPGFSHMRGPIEACKWVENYPSRGLMFSGELFFWLEEHVGSANYFALPTFEFIPAANTEPNLYRFTVKFKNKSDAMKFKLAHV